MCGCVGVLVSFMCFERCLCWLLYLVVEFVFAFVLIEYCCLGFCLVLRSCVSLLQLLFSDWLVWDCGIMCLF